MPEYRAFRNTDPPSLCALWRSRAGWPELRQPVSVELFEQQVFGKPWFDYEGLILAFEGEQPVGFAHASFEVDTQGSALNMQTGVVCLVCVRPGCAIGEVGAGLVQQCEAYLRRRGAKVVWGGAVGPMCPFYVGLYGGCDPPGVLDTDRISAEAFVARGFRETRERLIFRLGLADFRPAMDRGQIQLRRRLAVQVTRDPTPRSWWEACTAGDFELTRFDLVPRGEARPLAHAVVRILEASPGSSGCRAAGVIELEVEPQHRRQGLATFLLAEVLRALADEGVAMAEAQLAAEDAVAAGLLGKLGFHVAGRATAYCKAL